jgi:hypothetical protein
MGLSTKHIHMDHLNHVDLKAQNYGLYEKKTSQGVDTDACKLAKALLVTTLHPFSSLGLFNWT